MSILRAPLTAGRSVARFLIASDGSLVQRVLQSGVWVGVSNAGQTLLQTIRTIILARLLTPEIFGLMGICLVVIRGLELFTETGVGPALIHRQQRVEEARNTAFTLQIVRGFLLAGATLALAPVAAWYYGEPRLRDLVFLLATVFVVNGLANSDMILLRKNLDFRRLTMIDLLVAAISTAATAALAFALRSVWALVIGQVIMAALRAGLSYVLVPTRPTPRFDRQIARELLGYGRFITGLTIVLFVTTEIDNLVVGKVLGFEQLGYYAVAFTLANIPATHIAKIASNVVFPAYSTLQGDPVKIRIAFVTVLRAVSGIAIPAAAGLALLAPEILGVVYGAKWLPAVTPLRILALFGAARAVGMLSGYLYNALGKPHLSFYFSAAKLVLILGSIHFMTVRFGLAGAAIAVAVPQIVGDTIGLWVVQREIQLSAGAIIKVLGRTLLATSGMVAVIVFTRSWMGAVGGPHLLALIGIGMGTYALLSLGEIRNLYSEHIRRGLRRRAPALSTPPTV